MTDIKDLDTSSIFKIYKVGCIKVRKQDCGNLVKLLKQDGILLKISQISPVIRESTDKEDKFRTIYLAQSVLYNLHCNKKTKLVYDKETIKPKLIADNLVQVFDSGEILIELPLKLVNTLSKLEFVQYDIIDLKIEYDRLSYIECLKQCIPENIEITSSFETVGHIAHLNLNNNAYPYRYIIGKVLSDKNPGIKTVVTKVSNIENIYRTYPLEVVAGEKNLKAKVKEQGILYNVNIDEVYWNSRLSYERQRIVDIIPKYSFVVDLTCGVGAFTLPLLKISNCLVYSNDLNPSAIKLLELNISENKLDRDRVVISQRDVKSCIKNLLDLKLDINKLFNTQINKKIQPLVTYWICNLPEYSLNILSQFATYKLSLGKRSEVDESTQVQQINVIKCYFHFYCFSRSSEPFNDINSRIKENLKCKEDDETFYPINFSIHNVRDVAPNKTMYCAEFYINIPVIRDVVS
ncbi:Met-10 domain-containing protein [Cryptosporidium serpentis]